MRSSEGRSLRAIAHSPNLFFRVSIMMLFIRLYIAALTLIFLFFVVSHRGLGFLEAVVISSAIIYLILDTRSDLQASKREFLLLQELEEKVTALLR